MRKKNPNIFNCAHSLFSTKNDVEISLGEDVFKEIYQPNC